MKLVYVCSPYRGNVDKNVKFAQECCKEVMKNNAIPIAPHLYFTQFLNDDVHDERQLAFELNKFLIKQCDVLYIFGSIISEGMKIEIDYARSINKPVVKGVIKMNDTCVICDEYVPEGRQVCHSCEHEIKNQKVSLNIKTNDKIQVHFQICTYLNELYESKNHDYGDSFAKLRTEFPGSILVRVYDKYSRLRTLMKGADQKVMNESIDDTLVDLANYCIMELVERKMENEN